MGETAGLIQTIAVLAACVVFLAKQGFDAYKMHMKKDTEQVTKDPCKIDCMGLISDLHKWHRPVTDPETGQPRFMWYEDSKALRDGLRKNRECMDALSLAMGKVNESIAALVEELRSQQGSTRP